MPRTALARLAGVVAVAAAGLVPATPAVAGGIWGPGISYLNGVICADGGVRTALASWPGPNGPAFAVNGISAGHGTTSIPAVGGATAAVTPGDNGLSASQIGALAYLIQHYGSGSSAVVGDVAARVVGQANGNVYVTRCLNQGAGGLSAGTAATLWNDAAAHGGPYRVQVGGPANGLVPGRPNTVTAEVTSASGNAVPNLTVTFAASSGSLSSRAVTTDASGRASVQLTAAGATRVTASVGAVTGLLETTGGNAVPLVSAGLPTTVTGALDLASSATADPVLTVAGTTAVQPARTPLRAALQVGGMRGHKALATVKAYGPLAYSSRTGCRSHTSAEWTKLHAADPAGSTQRRVVGDGSYDEDPVASPTPGCYQLTATVRTTNATPNVVRSTVGSIVAVAPVSLTVTPAGHGIAPRGPLATTLTVQASDGAALTGVEAQLLGPLPQQDGACPSTGWDSARSGGTARTSGRDSVDITSSAVSRTGCYGFRITGRLAAPGSAANAVRIDPGPGNEPILVLTPAVALTDLSATHVDAGDSVGASVTLSGTASQTGQLHLQLLRLPYTSRGCVGLDWSQADAVAPAGTVPTTAVTKDATYQVRSPAVSGRGCWTVVPIFVATANAAVRASGQAGADDTLAFVGTAATAPTAKPTTAAAKSDPSHLGLTVGISVAVLLVVFALVLVLARRSAAAGESSDDAG